MADEPTDVVVFGPDTQSNFALSLDTSYQGEQEFFAGDSALPFRDGEQGTCNWARGVDELVEMRIIVIMDVGGYAIEKCGMLRIDLLAVVSQKGGCRGTVEWGQSVVLNGMFERMFKGFV